MAKGVRRCTVMRVERASEMVSRLELQGVYLHISQVIPMIRQCCYGLEANARDKKRGCSRSLAMVVQVSSSGPCPAIVIYLLLW